MKEQILKKYAKKLEDFLGDLIQGDNWRDFLDDTVPDTMEYSDKILSKNVRLVVTNALESIKEDIIDAFERKIKDVKDRG